MSGDTDDFKKWIEKIADTSDERKREISDPKNENFQLRMSIEAMQKKWRESKHILESVADQQVCSLS